LRWTWPILAPGLIGLLPPCPATDIVVCSDMCPSTAQACQSAPPAVFRRLDPRLRASITFDNDTGLRPPRSAGERLRDGDLVLRRLRLLAERRGREREPPAAARPAPGPRP
jgi:hypothetical protein